MNKHVNMEANCAALQMTHEPRVSIFSLSIYLPLSLSLPGSQTANPSRSGTAMASVDDSKTSRLSIPCMDLKIPTSIVRLLQTNCIPSPMDTQRISHLLAEQRLELSFIREELDRARAEVSRLEAKQSGTMEMVQKLEALRSPVRRMPIEIMAKVFDFCVRDEELQELDPLRAPLLLCQVCSAWRELMFSLPCLWRTLKLGFPSVTPNWDNVMQSRIMSMHVWISRTKALPISLTLEHPSNSPITWAALMSLDKELLTLGCRVEELCLRFSPLALSSLLTVTQSPLPHLRRLELHNSNPLPSNDNPPPLSLHDAPSLRSLSIAWGTLDTTKFRVPWSQLTELSLQYDASPYWNAVHNDYLIVLRQCPNLKCCSIGIGMTILDPDPDTIVPVSLPNLESMKVRLFCQTLYTQQFFDALHAPKLHTFEFQNVSLAMGSFASQTEPLPFISRSAATLENLSFDTINISDANMLSCLSQLHRLKRLRFLPGPLQLNHNLVDSLVLSGASQGASICPQLSSLSLKCSKRISVDRVTELVESRCSASPKLGKFCLRIAAFDYGQDSRDNTIAELRERLNQYVEGGLQLYLMKAKPTG
ncbi:hypothetical protein DEU56DRAFT_866617 [Suillus clintonianus]|uniref:uncharacterized protein n=1 Tax=Suillus clintonianus TaxID=1904413 RepID=UPI001B866CD0|nr:uncharacterized protein DEU56DRAFT_866617 [Suillus clintonianus]KAG2114419.1 hypothetical protein DEU56DRAFT_866617 [Suillus clintonianus]